MYRQLSPTELQQLQLYVNQAYQSSDSKDHKQEVELRLIPHRGWTTGKYNPDGERHARTRQGKVSGYNRYGQSQRGQQDHGTANRPFSISQYNSIYLNFSFQNITQKQDKDKIKHKTEEERLGKGR